MCISYCRSRINACRYGMCGYQWVDMSFKVTNNVLHTGGSPIGDHHVSESIAADNCDMSFV